MLAMTQTEPNNTPSDEAAKPPKRALSVLAEKANPRLILLSLVAAFVLTAVLMNFKMNIFEAFLYDFRMRYQGIDQTTSPLILIKIDDETVNALDETSTLSMDHHLALLKILSKTKAKAVTYFTSFNESINDSASQIKAAKDFVKLSNAMEVSGQKVLLGTSFNNITGEVLPPAPLDQIPHHMSIIHKDALVFSEDKVTRRALFSINGEKTIHTLIAETYRPRSAEFQYRGIYHASEVNSDYFMINFSRDTREGSHRFREFSFFDVIKGRISPSIFDGAIILIDTVNKDNSNDYVFTPFAREFFTNSKLVVHASIIQTLIDNSAIVNSTPSTDMTITFMLTAFIVWMVFNTTPARGVAITLLLAVSFFCTAMLLFRNFHYALNMSHPFLGIFFAYYVFVPYRLMMEYRKRSEFERSHEVLMQVDELKRNFMSLITHDLKTPVARIQGMTEMLGRAGADSKIVNAIIASTEELNRFITSILELAKVETDRVKLELVSKDINKVIEDCVRKFQYEAQMKGINISTELEPLFPIKIDIALVSKVISNLLDNALKYSPKGSEIVVSSQESQTRPGFIEISIKDNGIGISLKDQENLFLKFYRPQNDQTMVVKGYGLGLYLSKYFIELHQGTIKLESQPGKGSKFTILLPEKVKESNEGGLYA